MKRTIAVTENRLYFTSELPVHVNRISESFELGQHRHEFVEFTYVAEGRGFHYIEGGMMPVAKGDWFFLPVGVSHVFRPTTPSGGASRLIVYNCIFPEPFAASLAEGFEDERLRRLASTRFPEQPWAHLRDEDGEAQRAFERMLEEFGGKRTHFVAMIRAELIRLFAIVDRQALGETERGRTIRGATDEALEKLAARMRASPEDGAAGASAAEELGMSERHIRRRFKERFGMTQTEYAHKCRVARACELLADTGDKVSAIALSVGYKDLKFFNSVFKKLTGRTPSEYRSAMRGEAR